MQVNEDEYEERPFIYHEPTPPSWRGRESSGRGTSPQKSQLTRLGLKNKQELLVEEKTSGGMRQKHISEEIKYFIRKINSEGI